MLMLRLDPAKATAGSGAPDAIANRILKMRDPRVNSAVRSHRDSRWRCLVILDSLLKTSIFRKMFQTSDEDFANKFGARYTAEGAFLRWKITFAVRILAVCQEDDCYSR
ncbi:hypothetical protein Trydic_g12831 [Trypoxylus dichotomus]